MFPSVSGQVRIFCDLFNFFFNLYATKQNDRMLFKENILLKKVKLHEEHRAVVKIEYKYL